MLAKFTAIVTAAAIALTGMTPAPAQASDRDLARALAAIAGAAVIGVVIHEARKDKRHVAPRARYVPKRHHAKQYRSYQHRAHKPRRKAVERAYRQGVRDQRRAIRDRRAERRVDRRHDRQRGYSARPYGYGH